MKPEIIQPDPEAVKLAHKALDTLTICAKSAAEALKIACNPVISLTNGPSDVWRTNPGEVVEPK